MAKLPKYTLIVFLSLAVVYILISMMPNRIGIDVSPQEANANLHHRCLIPTSAAKVRYVSNVHVSRVNVWMSESEFRSWAQEREWTLKKQPPEEPYGVYLIDRQGETTPHISVSGGWKFTQEDKDSVFSGRYDTKLGLASVVFGGR